MEIFAKFKSAIAGAPPRLPIQPWARELVRAYEREAVRDQKVEACEIRRQILGREPGERMEVVSATVERLVTIDAERVRLRQLHDSDFMSKCDVLRGLMTRLLRARLPYDEERLATIVAYWVSNLDHLGFSSPGLIFHQIRLLCGNQPAKGLLAVALSDLSDSIRASRFASYADLRHQIDAIAELLAGPSQDAPELAPSPWSKLVISDLAGRPAEHPGRRAIVLALSASGKSKPSQAFLKSARTLMEEDPGTETQVLAWVDAYTPEAGKPDPNEDAIRGLIWLAAAAGSERVAAWLGAYCDLCFKKVQDWGARSVKLGNGAIQGLGLLGSGHAVAELTRLKKRLRYPTAVQRIEATLGETAARLGIDSSELEEMAVPTYELSAAGERRVRVGDGEAILRLGAKEVVVSWAGPNGGETKSPPKQLKMADPEGVKAARLLQKEIQQTLAGQSSRLEALYLSDRKIALAQWRERYANHPLLAGLTQRLLWRFEWDETSVSGLPRAGRVEDVAGRPYELPDRAVVSLLHPLFVATDEVLAWRQRLAVLEVTQPFKQAHREVYVLTDAERKTGTYSNRFAAHILRQHQFKALCDHRGWRFRLMGQWDSHNTPTRPLPRHGMSVEYWVDMIDESETSGMAIYMLISTDQVRFVTDDRLPVPLDRVPPLLFSEVMRDVDLFVGVSSVGNDPTWADGGPNGRFQTYWQNYAFGDLEESARSRGDVLSSLLPRLTIADRCQIDDRFLVVRGVVKTYKIHLGSGNVIMEPGGRYLCIVAGHASAEKGSRTAGLVLPFEGDAMLSLILSKAFLLAHDDRIADPTILSQINP